MIDRLTVVGLLVVVLGSLVLVPTASADHGPRCQSHDVACCSQYETGVNYAECVACVLVFLYWETHGNQCAA